jgi:hypothetical protein
MGPKAGAVQSHLRVPFTGPGAGSGELSWGQRLMWNAISRWNSSLALGGVSPLPPGMTTEQIAAAVGFVLSRHPSLRTRLEFAAPGSSDTAPRQVVADSGELAVEVVDAGDADPAAVAAEVRDRYHRIPFDYAAEWPVRMAVICRDGELTHLVAMYCHLALDGGGMDALLADLSTMDRATGRSAAPVTGVPPLEQARWEAGPAGQRHNAATLRHWDRLLRTIPARRFAEPASWAQPRFREVRARSAALGLAARLIAARTGKDTAAVLLAASATALTRVTGRHPSMAMILVNNRFRPGFADTVSTVSQPGLFVLDVVGSTFDEAVGRAWRSSLSAYKNAYCDPVQRDALHDRIAAERGEEVDLSCYFNDTWSVDPHTQDGPVPTAADVQAARPDGWLRWQDTPSDPSSERFFVYVRPAPGAVELQVNLDSRYVPPADAEAYLRELEAVAVAAATDPATVAVPQGFGIALTEY